MPYETRALTGVATITETNKVTATIYHVPLDGDYAGWDRYYFCCDVCGACGHHTLKHETALDEATWHVLHTHQEEDQDGRRQEAL